MPVSADWQIDYNGLTIGDGTPYDLVQIEGLLDLPEVRTADRPRLLADGLAAGRDNIGGRSITLTIEVWPDNPADLGLMVSNVQTAFTLLHDTEIPLSFQLPGVAESGFRLVNCRTRRRSAPLDLDFLQGHTQFVIQLDASDPRVYDFAKLTPGQVGLPTNAGGLTFEATAPLQFGAMPTGGQFTAYNAGNVVTYPTVRVAGPTPPGGFWLSNDTTGETWTCATVLGTGQWLDIDMLNCTVLLNGLASRFTDVDPASAWFGLTPKVTNSFSFRAAAFTAATATLAWRSAWL